MVTGYSGCNQWMEPVCVVTGYSGCNQWMGPLGVVAGCGQ